VTAREGRLLVATRAQIPEGCMRRVEVADRSWVLFNDGGRITAAADVCPHKGAPLSAGEFDDGVVVCPLHGWEFDVQTGECLSMPEWSGLDRATVIVDGEMVYIES
jgi:nitrite reductase/ring-hydroxylating ferredoxin subunit